MQLGLIGLGRMGANMVQRLTEGGHTIVGFDQNLQATEQITRHGAVGATTLSPGDILIDGGNSHYQDSIRRAEALRRKKIAFLDVGTSGGVWGLSVGYCLMIGGEEEIFKKLEPIFKTLAPKEGYLYCGTNGAGHFVKMVHNGIEYRMLQAYGEGFELLKFSPFGLDLGRVAHLYLRSGKRLAKKTTEIAIQFKPVPHLFFKPLVSEKIQPNALVLSVQPSEGISLTFPGQTSGAETLHGQCDHGFQL